MILPLWEIISNSTLKIQRYTSDRSRKKQMILLEENSQHIVIELKWKLILITWSDLWLNGSTIFRKIIITTVKINVKLLTQFVKDVGDAKLRVYKGIIKYNCEPKISDGNMYNIEFSAFLLS